jgi:hypothetical protein
MVGAPIVIVSVPLVWLHAVNLLLSVTVTAKVNVPTDFGVPLITPEVESVSPVGSEPEASVVE